MALFDGVIQQLTTHYRLGGAAQPMLKEVLTLVAGGPGGLGGFIDKLYATGLGPHLTAWLAGTPGHGLSTGGVERLVGGAALAGIAGRARVPVAATKQVIRGTLPSLLALLAPHGVPSAEAAAAVAGLIGTPEPLLSEPIRPRTFRAPPIRIWPSMFGTLPEDAATKWAVPVAFAIALPVLFLHTRQPPPKPPQPVAAVLPATSGPRLWISNDNGTAVVNGSVPDAGIRTGLIASLRNIFGGDKVRTNIVVDPTVGGAAWLGPVAAAFPKLSTNGVSALFDGNGISLGGLASEAETNGLIAALKTIFGSDTRFGSLADRANDLVAGATRQATAALASLGTVFSAGDLTEALNHAIINFDTDSAALPPGAVALLNLAAGKLRSLPAGTVIEIAGYTDNAGDAAANLALSQKRADAVRDQLVGAGVAAAMVVAKGYGSADPVASNDTAVGRFRNRRIAYRVVAGG